MENSNNSAHDPVSSSLESPDKSSDFDDISVSSDGTESASDVSPRIMKWNPVTLSLGELRLSDRERKKVKSRDSSDLVPVLIGDFEGKLAAEVGRGEENSGDDGGQKIVAYWEKIIGDIFMESEVYSEANSNGSSSSSGCSTESEDADTAQQEALILTRQSEEQPLIGDKESLLALAAEYESGSPIIQAKIKILSEEYSTIRRTRRDGNCFFRGFIFSYLEHLLQTHNNEAVDQLSVYHDHTSANYTFIAFLEELINLLEGDKKPNIHDFLLQGGLDVSLSEEAISFFRSIASYEIQERSEFFEPFVKGSTGETVAEFCTNSVEQMANETDHIEITALSEALEVHTRVVYLDQSVDSEGRIKVNYHDFKPEASDEPVVTLLYRPGHYDILYR